MDDQHTTPNRLKVSYYDGAVAFGGSLQVLSMLFANLDRTRIDPELIACTPPQQLEGRFKSEDIGLLHIPRLHYVQRKRWLARLNQHRLIRKVATYLFSAASTIANLPTQYQIYRHLKAQKPDALHVNNSFTPILPALALNIPVIWHLHGTPFPPSRWEKYLLNRVKRFVTISDHITSQAVQAGFPQEKILTIQNPAPAALFTSEDSRSETRRRYSIPTGHKLVIHVGRIIPWKGQLEFLKAFSLALKSDSELSALIVGDDAENLNPDYIQKLKNFVEENGLSERVIFTGQVSNAVTLMAAADLFVHSSTTPEPFGLVIVEAMSAGTPVIAANSGAPKSIIDHGKTGFIVDPLDTEALSNLMLNILQNDALRAKISKSAREFISSNFSASAFSIQFSSLYIDIISDHQKSTTKNSAIHNHRQS